MIGLLPLSTFFRAQGQGESKYLHGLRGDSFHWDGPSLGCKSQFCPIYGCSSKTVSSRDPNLLSPRAVQSPPLVSRTRLNLHTNNSASIKHYCEL
jgi:hypothetical protein